MVPPLDFLSFGQRLARRRSPCQRLFCSRQKRACWPSISMAPRCKPSCVDSDSRTATVSVRGQHRGGRPRRRDPCRGLDPARNRHLTVRHRQDPSVTAASTRPTTFTRSSRSSTASISRMAAPTARSIEQRVRQGRRVPRDGCRDRDSRTELAGRFTPDGRVEPFKSTLAKLKGCSSSARPSSPLRVCWACCRWAACPAIPT